MSSRYDVHAVTTWDTEADALYIRLVENIGPGEVEKSESVALTNRSSEVVFDFDAEGYLLGIEIIGVGGMVRRKQS